MTVIPNTVDLNQHIPYAHPFQVGGFHQGLALFAFFLNVGSQAAIERPPKLRSLENILTNHPLYGSMCRMTHATSGRGMFAPMGLVE